MASSWALKAWSQLLLPNNFLVIWKEGTTHVGFKFFVLIVYTPGINFVPFFTKALFISFVTVSNLGQIFFLF